ncbi:reverse transcriptase domain-containing protein [Tanacetum coccineum]
MKDQPLPADASPTALSPGYIANSDPKEDKNDPDEDPADYPVDGGDNDDNESSDDEDDDDHATVGCGIIYAMETMTTINQGMSVEEIERVVAQRVANVIEAIAIYETKTNISRKAIIQTERQEDKVAENASNKREWEDNHNGSSSQQNKEHKMFRAQTTGPSNQKVYYGTLPLCNRCKLHHNGPCTVECENCKKVGHMTWDCRNLAVARNQRTHTCYKCGSLRHFKSECPIVKFQKCVDKKISTFVERQAENKRKHDNNNQAQQQLPKRQNMAQAYAAGTGERKEYDGTLPLCNKCKFHHSGPCTGHYKSDCPRLKNQSHGNQVGGQTAIKLVRQKSYADVRRKPVEFQVDNLVMLKVLEQVESVAYKLKLPQELSRVHNTFHVSNLKKCYSDDPLVVPLEGLQVDNKLHFVEEPVEIMDREVKQLRRSRVPIVKVRWNSRRGPEFTWEREDQFRKKYPHLFTKTAPSSITRPGSLFRCDPFWGCYNWVSETEEEDVPKIKTVEIFNKPSYAKINFVKSTKQVKSPRNTSVDKNRKNIPSPRGNKRNWNQQMSQKLGNDFEMFNKACHMCGSFEHLRKDSITVSLDLSRLATTLNRLERSIQTGINKWYQSLLRNSE